MKRVYDDAQLKLYHKLIPGDFLHYGYFDRTDIHPLDISLRMIYEAQLNYAKQLIEHIKNLEGLILDIGCGMGGLLRELNALSYQVDGLTPDKNQVHHIRNTYPNKVYECKFEDLEVNHQYATLITSESLQYLDLDRALPLMNKLLQDNGRWISCDYFRIGEAVEKSGHSYELFREKLNQHGFHITYERDITPHILPTIAYVHHWATQILMPLKEYGIEKLQVKGPGYYYAVKDSLPKLDAKLKKYIDTIDPEIFKAQKSYRLMVIERM